MRYLFEDYAVDTDRRELCRRGRRWCASSRKPSILLEYLIRNRQRVVSRDDLIAAIWDGRIISKSAMTTRINAVRYAIGDAGKAQRLIKTVPRKGIRFVGTVREEQASGTDVGLRPSTVPPRPPGQALDRRSRFHQHERRPAARSTSATASPRTSSPVCRDSPSCS